MRILGLPNRKLPYTGNCERVLGVKFRDSWIQGFAASGLGFGD